MTVCLLCREAPAVQAHHPTARGVDGRYLDRRFVVAVCRSCNLGDHRAWRVAGLDRISDPNFARLRRVAFLLVRLADVGSSLPPEASGELAGVLGIVAEAWSDRGTAA